MAFDGLVTTCIAQELNHKIVNGRIEKIHQPASEELLFQIRQGRTKYRLYLSASSSRAGLYLTETRDTNPASPPAFCMLLRKHLQGARIREIRQVDSERMIEIDTDSVNELGFRVSHRLIIEIMGKHSNIILTDIETGKILDSIKRISIDVNRYRQTLPGITYVAPPSHGKIPYFNLTEDAFLDAVSQTGRPLEQALVASIQGISPLIASELCFRAEQTAGRGFTEQDVYFELQKILHDVASGDMMPSVYKKEDGSPLEFHAIELQMLGDRESAGSVSCGSISEAAEIYFEGRDSSNRMRQKSSDIRHTVNSAIQRQQLKKQRLSEDLIRAEDADRYRLYGELLTASLHTVAEGRSEAEVVNYYDGSTLTIPLDPRYSASRNAQIYYKKYTKSKTAKVEKTAQLEQTSRELEYLESVLSFIDTAQTSDDLEAIRSELTENGYLRPRGKKAPKKNLKLPPHEYRTTGGLRILAGRNNKQNDQLTFHTASSTDIWLHTKDIPGSHVILHTEGTEPEARDIYEAASVAAFHSKANQSSNVPVDYVRVRYVKKPSGSRPGFVIFTHNRTVYVDPALPESEEAEQ